MADSKDDVAETCSLKKEKMLKVDLTDLRKSQSCLSKISNWLKEPFPVGDGLIFKSIDACQNVFDNLVKTLTNVIAVVDCLTFLLKSQIGCVLNSPMNDTEQLQSGDEHFAVSIIQVNIKSRPLRSLKKLLNFDISEDLNTKERYYLRWIQSFFEIIF